jgi:hypothetical protein
MSFCPIADTIGGGSTKEDEMQNLTKEVSIRKVIAAEFLSLDGVMEAPNEWRFPYFNDEMGRAIGEGFTTLDALLMGRVILTAAPTIRRRLL